MRTDCSLLYKFNAWKFQAQTLGEHVVYRNCFWHSEQFLYTTCSPHVLQKEELLTKIYLYSVKHSMIERGIRLLAPADVLKSFTFTTDMVSKIWVQLPAAYGYFLKWPFWTAKGITYDGPPKMQRDAWQKSSFNLKKGLFFCRASLFIFGLGTVRLCIEIKTVFEERRAKRLFSFVLYLS